MKENLYINNMCEECKWRNICHNFDIFVIECEDFIRDNDKKEDDTFRAEKFCLSSNK